MNNIFDWQYYLDNNLDLRPNGVQSKEQAMLHWNTYGKHENRTVRFFESISINNTLCVSGERIQEIAEVYLGLCDDFSYNPYISNQTDKHKNLLEITSIYNNPRIVFCYTHRIDILSDKIQFFNNNFILITHNSDKNITYNDRYVERIYNCNKLIKWYTQNLCIEHHKISFLPIGIANNQWEHGSMFMNFYNNYKNTNNIKIKHIYFLFDMSTNIEKRKQCYDSIINKVPFLNKIQPYDNYNRLSEYEFCICPEGNGIDTHRFWEALYLKCIPIVIKNPLTEIIHKSTNLPMILLNTWDELDVNTLPVYTSFDFVNCSHYLDINFYKIMIQ